MARIFSLDGLSSRPTNSELNKQATTKTIRVCFPHTPRPEFSRPPVAAYLPVSKGMLTDTDIDIIILPAKQKKLSYLSVFSPYTNCPNDECGFWLIRMRPYIIHADIAKRPSRSCHHFHIEHVICLYLPPRIEKSDLSHTTNGRKGKRSI